MLIVPVISILLLVYFTRREDGSSIQPTALAALTHKSLDEMVASKSQEVAGMVIVWSVCLLNADLDLR